MRLLAASSSVNHFDGLIWLSCTLKKKPHGFVCEAAEVPKNSLESEWHPIVPWPRYSRKLSSYIIRPCPFCGSWNLYSGLHWWEEDLWPKLSNLEVSIPSFVGSMLTFLKPGSDLVGVWRVPNPCFEHDSEFVLHTRKPYPSHCQNSKQLRDIAINASQLSSLH